MGDVASHVEGRGVGVGEQGVGGKTLGEGRREMEGTRNEEGMAVKEKEWGLKDVLTQPRCF